MIGLLHPLQLLFGLIGVQDVVQFVFLFLHDTVARDAEPLILHQFGQYLILYLCVIALGIDAVDELFL